MEATLRPIKPDLNKRGIKAGLAISKRYPSLSNEAKM